MQQGHAVLVKTDAPPASGASPAKTTASADRIAYDGTSGKIELSGGAPRITQGDSELTAAAIVFNHDTQDATASGGIKATYTHPAKAGAGANEAMHVIADHAALDHAKDETTFFGAAHADARLWQGASSIMAPTIVLAKTRQVLTANGPAAGVKATFIERTNGRPAKEAAPASGATSPQNAVVRTTSSSLVYSGGERKVTLTGNVVAQDATGMLRAGSVELYLNQGSLPSTDHAAARPDAAGASAMSPNGQVDRLIAEDRVQFTQGDRSATGGKLVYTAEDGRYVLTGTNTVQPRVTDVQHGTVSGSSLIFNNRDDSVVVNHGQSPTMTDTRTTHDASGSHAH